MEQAFSTRGQGVRGERTLQIGERDGFTPARLLESTTSKRPAEAGRLQRSCDLAARPVGRIRAQCQQRL